MSVSQLLSAFKTLEDTDILQTLLPAAVSEIKTQSFSSETWTRAKAAEVVTAVSDWILRFSASKKLSQVLNFLEAFLRFCGLGDELDFTVETEDGEDPGESITSAAFVSCLLSLLNSVITSSKLEKYGKILLTLLRISAMTVSQPNIASAFRRKGLLKQLHGLLCVLLKQSSLSDIQKALQHALLLVLTKLALFHEKSRDYLMRKGNVQMIATVLNTDIREADRMASVADMMVFLGALAGSNDQQLLVWISNGAQIALRYYAAMVDSAQSRDVRSAALYLLWRMTINNVEIQHDFKALKVDQIALESLLDPNSKLETLVFTIGILRRMSANPEFKTELAPMIGTHILKQLAMFSKSGFSMLLKEAVACLGTISTEESSGEMIMSKNGPELILDIAIRNISSLKLLKTCVGALVNLSLNGTFHIARSMERLANNSYFYQLADAILERHSASVYFLDYTLRLLTNALESSKCR